MLNSIMVVDDNEVCRELLAELFEVEFDIIQAKNGVDAISALSISIDKVEAVLLDLVMPRMDGFQFLEEFNMRGWNEKVPVIVISSNDDEESRKRCKEYGVDYFIAKPYDKKKALATINEAIETFKQD